MQKYGQERSVAMRSNTMTRILRHGVGQYKCSEGAVHVLGTTHYVEALCT